ncbi:MAG: restriction endonuclease subunit R [bacterium]
MFSMPQKIQERISNGIKRFQPVLLNAKSRDVNESDTVTIIADILYEVLGFDKYSEITSELMIRGTYCDLATKLNGTYQYLIEAKAIGIELKETAVKQAVDYAANKGIEWVILTNGNIWKVFRVIFAKPINQELILEFDFQSLNHKNLEHVSNLFMLSKEGWIKSHILDFAEQKQALSKFFIAAVLLSDTIIESIKKELKKLCPEIRIEIPQIKNVISQEVLKREVVEGEKVEEAKKKLNKCYVKLQKQKAKTVQSTLTSV